MKTLQDLEKYDVIEAIDPCLMEDNGGEALVVGKNYLVVDITGNRLKIFSEHGEHRFYLNTDNANESIETFFKIPDNYENIVWGFFPAERFGSVYLYQNSFIPFTTYELFEDRAERIFNNGTCRYNVYGDGHDSIEEYSLHKPEFLVKFMVN